MHPNTAEDHGRHMKTIFCRDQKDKARAAEAILNLEGPCAVDIEEGDIRTIKQNSRYWSGVVTATQATIERELGTKHTKEAVHEYFKRERYGVKVDTIGGKVIERSARSRKMTIKQFAKFTEWAEAHAITELGVDPADIDYHARGSDL